MPDANESPMTTMFSAGFWLRHCLVSSSRSRNRITLQVILHIATITAEGQRQEKPVFRREPLSRKTRNKRNEKREKAKLEAKPSFSITIPVPCAESPQEKMAVFHNFGVSVASTIRSVEVL
jgi:hypothetical protein